MTASSGQAAGWPGMEPRWTSSAKVGVGSALGPASRVWFTLSHGVFNEIYYPRVDRACTRDLGLIVTDGRSFFSEERRHTHHEVAYLAEGVPAYRLTNTCEWGRYRVVKEVIADPERDVVLQRTRFDPVQGGLGDYHLYALLAPHLGNQGYGNTAWVGDVEGAPMLLAERQGGTEALALACSAAWLRRSSGFVGVSDGWQDLMAHKQMTWSYQRADNGNVALVGEVDLRAAEGEFTLALGFGANAQEAGQHAAASLRAGFDAALSEYRRAWAEWQQSLTFPQDGGDDRGKLYPVSMAVLRTSEDKEFPGGVVASLAIPWGDAKGDSDLGGYHLIWTRDLVEAAGAMVAAGARGDVDRVLRYLQATQHADGHWPQNMWLDGAPYWTGIQLDETAFPILLAAMARREQMVDEGRVVDLWQMMRRAAAFIVANGPVTQQDRWEEDPGYSPFTLAVEIAALLAAADLADDSGEPDAAGYLRETADAWNDSIERWTYATDTDLARQAGVDGHYVRIAPPEAGDTASPAHGYVPIKNRPPGQSSAAPTHMVSPDALALVRFGLRAPDDARIVNTVKVIDATLKVETPNGPVWHRYNDDGYGEHADGSPFDGTGTGRGWPLLVGERAHYELAAGRPEQAARLLTAMESFANEGGLIPEQVWDSADIAGKGLRLGRPSGSAMPLVWAHAEYVKLCRSLRDGRVFDTPPPPVQRYLVDKTRSRYASWRFNNKCRVIPPRKLLRLELLAAAMIHWSEDDWQTSHDVETRDTGLSVHIADLPTDSLPADATVRFTFHWREANRWEGADFSVQVGEP
jgi:glucoamylase